MHKHLELDILITPKRCFFISGFIFDDDCNLILCNVYTVSLKIAICLITYRDTVEVGLIHDIQHHLSYFAVIHCEVVIGVLPLLDPEQFHHASQGFSNDPDPIVGKAMKLAGLYTFLPQLLAVLPLILLGGLKKRSKRRNYFLNMLLFYRKPF